MVRLFILTISLFFVIAPAIAQSDTDVNALIENGNNFLKNKQYKEAEKSFAEAFNIKKNPEIVSSYINCLLAQKNIKKAFKVIDKCIAEDNKEPEYMLIRGNLYSVKKDYTTAIKEISKGIEMFPKKNLENYYMYRGVAKEKNRDQDEAIDDLKKSIEINPENAIAYYYYGSIAYKLEQYDTGAEQLTYAIEKGYSNQFVYFVRGMAFLKMDDKAKACTDFREACKQKNINACKMIMVHCDSGTN